MESKIYKDAISYLERINQEWAKAISTHEIRGFSYERLTNDFTIVKSALYELEKENEGVKDFKYHYDSYKTKLANNLKTINCMQEEATTNYNLIEQLEDRNDRVVERLEKQKAELKELREFKEFACNKGILKNRVTCNLYLHYYLNKTNDVYNKLKAISNRLEEYHIQSVITVGNHWGECWEFFAKQTTTLEIAEYIYNFIRSQDLHAKIGYDDNYEFYLSA